MTPEHVALFGYLYVLACAPLVAGALIVTVSGHGRWMGRGFAAGLLACWLPLALAAPQVIGSLLP